MTAPPSRSARASKLWLLTLPIFPPVSLLALITTAYTRHFPRPFWWVIGAYAASQQIPALLAPEPLLATLLALARTILIIGLLGMGAALAHTGHYKWIAAGLTVTLVIAFTYSVANGANLFTARLSHPYMTSITLGLAGAISLWIALFHQGKPHWRYPLSALALFALLASGSRGPLLAALIGAVIGFITSRQAKHQNTYWPLLLLLTTGLTLGIGAGRNLDATAVTRLTRTDTAGRQLAWQETRSIIQATPLSGVGSYRLGVYLRPADKPCELFPDSTGKAAACPAWLSKLGSPWLIAHSLLLQQWAETGPLGTLGLMTLLGFIVICAFHRRDPLSTAILSGLLIASLTDNTLLIPSPFFAELFWVTAGIQLVNLPPNWLPRWDNVGWAITALLVVFSLPLLMGRLIPTTIPPVQLLILNAASQVRASEPYSVLALVELPAGLSTLALQRCELGCRTVESMALSLTVPEDRVLRFSGQLGSGSVQNLKLISIQEGRWYGVKILELVNWQVITK